VSRRGRLYVFFAFVGGLEFVDSFVKVISNQVRLPGADRNHEARHNGRMSNHGSLP
jgi:hypothetical protein